LPSHLGDLNDLAIRNNGKTFSFLFKQNKTKQIGLVDDPPHDPLITHSNVVPNSPTNRPPPITATQSATEIARRKTSAKEFFANFKHPEASKDWYFPHISQRTEAEELLSTMKQNCFLVRQSSHGDNSLVLSVFFCDSRECRHLKIDRKNEKLVLKDTVESVYDTLDSLVEAFKRNYPRFFPLGRLHQMQAMKANTVYGSLE